jgi:hypothetical protein
MMVREPTMTAASSRFDERLLRVPERTVLIQRAFRLEWLTVAWMVIEALVAIVSGRIAGSLTLTAFGLDSLLELVSAGVLIWRLTDELRRGQEFSRHAERIAIRISGLSSLCWRPTSWSAPSGVSGHTTAESSRSPALSSLH